MLLDFFHSSSVYYPDSFVISPFKEKHSINKYNLIIYINIFVNWCVLNDSLAKSKQ